jgi:AcrR family transcriptional regulator
MSQTQPINTRQSILDAAIAEFWEHGYRGASVREICKRAGTSSNAITYHFGSKKKLYQAILDRFVALQLEHTHTALSAEIRSQEEFEIRLEMFMLQLLQAYLENRESLLIILREFEQLETGGDDNAIRHLIDINHALSDFVRKAKDQGLVDKSVDPDIVSGTLLDRLINQARYAHTHMQLFNVSSLDPEYRTYWARSSLGLVLNGMKPRQLPAPQSSKGNNHAHRANN